MPPRKERPLSFALPPVVSVEDTTKAINGVLAALAQGFVTLGEASDAIDLIERCRRIIGPALPASLEGQSRPKPRGGATLSSSERSSSQIAWRASASALSCWLFE